MSQINTTSHYGQKVAIDQCQNCGGIWFDQNELYIIPSETAIEIDSIDVEKIGTTPLPTQPLLCPRDKTALKQFSDANFPKHIIIERCNQCKGFWFNSGELSEYKKTVEHHKTTSETISLQTYPYHPDVSMLTGLADFLSMRINLVTKLPEAWGIPGLIEPTDEYQREARDTYYLFRYLLYGIGL